MKILYTNFHSGDGGGHTTYILNLVRVLSRRHQVAVAAPRSSRLYQSARNMPGVDAFDFEFRNTLGCMTGTALALRRLVELNGYDVVHVNGSADHRVAGLATLGMSRKRPRIVFTKHNDLPASGLGTWLKGTLGTDSVICVSEYTRRFLTQTVYGRKVMRVVHHGVDLSRFIPARASAVNRTRQFWFPELPDDTLVVGSTAGMDDNKSWLDMVAAVALLPEAQRRRIRIALAGHLPNERQRARVAELGMTDQVIYAGLLRDVRSLVTAFDVGFVLSQRETLSFACREMMAMGKPMIVSDAGGLPENISAGVDGWIVPPRGHAHLAQLLEHLLGNRPEVARAGAAARTKSEQQFSMETFAERTEAVYQECLRRKGSTVSSQSRARAGVLRRAIRAALTSLPPI